MSTLWQGVLASLLLEALIVAAFFRLRHQGRKLDPYDWTGKRSHDLSKLRLHLALRHTSSMTPVFLFGLAIIGLWPIFAVTFGRPLSREQWAGFNLIMFAFSIGMWVLQSKTSNRKNSSFFKKLRELAGKVCPVCLYYLPDMKGDCKCPECGTPLNIEFVQRVWLGEPNKPSPSNL